VLLPIFDHVRAEVTDTTTFTSEKRRAQEDAWLYETCTKCLQHLVDLYVQYYAVLRPLLGRVLELLATFMRRSHQSLAAVGVAAFVRLLVASAPQLDAAAWAAAFDALSEVVEDTRPDAEELVTPPARSVPAPDGPPAGSPAPLRVAYTLREGLGARRLGRFRCHASVQLLLTQACGELYGRAHRHMGPAPTRRLLDAVAGVAANARRQNADGGLRRRLAAAQLADGVPEERCAPDPPLLRLEAEASHAYLSIAMHIAAARGDAALAAECDAPGRVLAACAEALRRYAGGAPPDGPSPAAPGGGGGGPQAQQQQRPGGGPAGQQQPAAGGARPGAAAGGEYAAMSPLAAAALRALCALDPALLTPRLPELFPLLASLIRCDYASRDVHRALSDLFLRRVGPLLGPVPTAAAPAAAAPAPAAVEAGNGGAPLANGGDGQDHDAL